ncbi:hypothetical protein J6590_100136 [Homalodisca vitripennis]|nr:hypothetical protein J6590_100136 [Homalodisca vitripennis]
MTNREGGAPLMVKAVIDKPLAKKPAQKAPSSRGEWEKHPLPSILSAVWIVSGSRYFVPTPATYLFHKYIVFLCVGLYKRKILIEQTYVAIDVSRSFRFDVGLAAQWLGQGIEQAGECRAVVGILEERRRGLYPTLRELKPPSVFL